MQTMTRWHRHAHTVPQYGRPWHAGSLLPPPTPPPSCALCRSYPENLLLRNGTLTWKKNGTSAAGAAINAAAPIFIILIAFIVFMCIQVRGMGCCCYRQASACWLPMQGLDVGSRSAASFLCVQCTLCTAMRACLLLPRGHAAVLGRPCW